MPVQIPSILDNENLLDEPGSRLDREPSGTIEELPTPAGQHEDRLDAFLRGPERSNASTAVGHIQRAVVSAEVATVQANPFFPQTVLQSLPLARPAHATVAPQQSLPESWANESLGNTVAPRVAARRKPQVKRLDPVTGIHPPRKPTNWNPVIQP